MATTDSVSVFAEGTFSEQIKELVDYIARSIPEDQRADYVQPFQDALATPEGGNPIEEDEARRRTVFSTVLEQVKGLGEGSEKEIEGFFNLLFSHFLTLFPLDTADETQKPLASILQVIASSPGHTIIKYRILSNLSNAIPRKCGLRLPVHFTLIEIASANDELPLLGLSRTDVEKWLSEWDVGASPKSKFLKLIADAFAKNNEPLSSYEYTLSYVRSLSPGSPEARAAALDAIATALRLPSLFDYEPLFRLDSVVAAKDHELFSLLQIFLNEGLSQYAAWAASHADALIKYNLDKTELERKIRLLSLATLGFQNIGQDLPYSTIAEALQVEPSQVERWAIDVIRAGLLSGRLSQTTQTLHVTRASARAFEREQWLLLQKRLAAWKTGLADVLEVVAAARKKNAAVAEALQPSANTPVAIDTSIAPTQATVVA